MNRHFVRLTLAALLLSLLGALPATAAKGIWTAVASTGVVDESAAGFYSFGSTNLGYTPGTTIVSPIVARYDVTKTWFAGDMAPWTTLELGYFNNSVMSSVQATLFQVDRCTGVQAVVCTVTSNVSTTSTCGTCNFAAGTVNFATNLYYVQVTLSRATNTVVPQALTLRIF